MCLLSGLDTEVEHMIGGLRKAYLQNPDLNGLKAGLVWCPHTDSILLNSTPGFLQFYNPSTDSVTREVYLYVVVLWKVYSRINCVCVCVCVCVCTYIVAYLPVSITRMPQHIPLWLCDIVSLDVYNVRTHMSYSI